MNLNGLNILTVVALLIAVLFSARVPDQPLSHSIPDWHIDTRLNEKKSEITCMPRCTPDRCAGHTCVSALARKRALYGAPNLTNATDWEELDGQHMIEKRLLRDQRAANIAKYLDRQSDTPAIIELCPPGGTGGFYPGSPTFCVQQRFSNAPLNSAGQWLAGTANTSLTGCTVLVVVSARAVYMCHFWQDLHYMQLQDARTYYGFGPVVNMIRGAGPTPGAVGPALNVNLFNDATDNTWAFIMTPRNGAFLNNPLLQHFALEYNTLTTLLGGLIPGISIICYNYIFTYAMPKGVAISNGVALFEYDNNADGGGNADWRVWFEASNERGSQLGQAVSQHD